MNLIRTDAHGTREITAEQFNNINAPPERFMWDEEC